MSEHEADFDSGVDVHVVILVGDVRTIDDVVVEEGQPDHVADLVIGGDIDGHGEHAGRYLGEVFDDFAEDGFIVAEGEIDRQVEVADYLSFHPGEDKSDGNIFKTVATAKGKLMGINFGNLVIGEAQRDIPAFLEFDLEE